MKILLASVFIMTSGMVVLIRLTPLALSVDFLILLAASLLLSWFNYGLLDFLIGYFHLWKLLMLATMTLFADYELLFRWTTFSDTERLLYLLFAVTTFIGLFSWRLEPQRDIA